jgi:hypothetical protein
MSERRLGARIDDLPLARARADHEEHARLFARSDEDVSRPGRTVEEVPGSQPALFLLDDRDALAREDEEVLLARVGVVEAARLPR